MVMKGRLGFMKLIKTTVAIAALTAISTMSMRAQDVAVDFGEITPAAGARFVEVNIQSNLISMVTRLAKGSEPEVAEILGGLKQVRVNVLGLTDENREQVIKRVESIRTSLKDKGWERIVTAQEDSQDVGVFIKLRGDEAVEGVVVTVLHGDKEAVLVNVVGNLQPEKLAMLGERFDIEPLKKLKMEAKQ